MNGYELIITKDAEKDIRSFARSGDKSSARKVNDLLNELRVHPYTGTGKPEPLKDNWSGYWSRRINKKDRLIYAVEEDRSSLPLSKRKNIMTISNQGFNLLITAFNSISVKLFP